MPAYDRTGPKGMGSMSGRGMGNCTKHIAAQTNNRNCGNGLRQRNGNGNGFARRINQATGNDIEVTSLEKKIEDQQDQLNTMKLRLDELKN